MYRCLLSSQVLGKKEKRLLLRRKCLQRYLTFGFGTESVDNGNQKLLLVTELGLLGRRLMVDGENAGREAADTMK